LDDFATLQQKLGDIERRDEIAELADGVKAGQITEVVSSLSDRLGPGLTLLHDPTYPENLALGKRILSYAGIVTDTAEFGVVTNILRELVRTSTSTVRNFITYVPLVVYSTLYSGEDNFEDVTWLLPFTELAHNLLQLYMETGSDI